MNFIKATVNNILIGGTCLCMLISHAHGQQAKAADIDLKLSEEVHLKMKPIPAGSFKNSDVNKTITIKKNFWMGETEVTQAQYETIMDVNPSFNKKGGDYPVEMVTWEDAMQFCKKLNKLCEGKIPAGYRIDLPTEGQWEHACRAGTNTDFHYGASLSSTQANFVGDSPWPENAPKGPDLKHTTEVKSYLPNKWGLYDMHGNVFEWCRDWFDEKWSHNPETLSGMKTAKRRAYRGGHWRTLAWFCRSSFRFHDEPTKKHDGLGFRIAMVPVK